jgi:hypothetical protein
LARFFNAVSNTMVVWDTIVFVTSLEVPTMNIPRLLRAFQQRAKLVVAPKLRGEVLAIGLSEGADRGLAVGLFGHGPNLMVFAPNTT